jgi:drug/metabolite transporter (DMT)-like permease
LSAVDLALVLASALLHAWWSTSIKASGDPLIFNVLQEVAAFALALAVLPTLRPAELPPALWHLLALTAVAHALYFYWMSRAYEHGDLSLVYPVARSTPAFLPLVAVPLLGERLSLGGLIGIAVVVAGIWLVHAGTGLRWRALVTPAARYAWLTLAATVAYSLVDKQAMAQLADAPWSSPVPRAAAWGSLLAAASGLLFTSLVLAMRGWRRIAAEARRGLGPATAASLVSFASYTLVLRALETSPASYVVAARQTSVVFALALATWRLGERPDRARVAGALATVAGVAAIVLLGQGAPP